MKTDISLQKIYIFTDFESFEKNDLQDYISSMPAERIQKYNRYLKKQDKLNCVASYLLLSYCLKLEFGIKSPPKFEYKENDKPYLFSYPHIYFSISHTSGAVICALSPSEIGVDVERIRVSNDSLTKRICSDREYEEYLTCENKSERLLKIWTKKESYIKMTSDSVFRNLSGLDTCSFKNLHSFRYNDFVIGISSFENKPTEIVSVSTYNLLSEK